MKTKDIIKQYAALTAQLNELSKPLPEGDAIVKGLLNGSISKEEAATLINRNERWELESNRWQQADDIQNQIPRFAQWWMNREGVDRVYFVAGDVMHDKVSINRITRGHSIWDSPCGMDYRHFKDGAVVACSAGTLHLRNLEDPLEAHYIGRMTDEEWERFASGDEQQVSKYLPKHLVWRKGGKNDK